MGISSVFDGAAETVLSHPSVAVRFTEITPDMPDEILGQLVQKDAVHDFGTQSLSELRHYRVGGVESEKRCFAMIGEGDVLHSAIYVHAGNKPINAHTDLAGDVMPILQTPVQSFLGKIHSFNCYSISSQLSETKRTGPILVRNLHNFLTTNYAWGKISTLSPMRKFDDRIQGQYTEETWRQEHDSIRLLRIMDYLMSCENDVQRFHMGNGATIGAIRLSTPDGAGDSFGLNRCMINYLYHQDICVLEQNARAFKSIVKNGGSIIDAGLVEPELIEQVYGMVETRAAARVMRLG